MHTQERSGRCCCRRRRRRPTWPATTWRSWRTCRQCRTGRSLPRPPGLPLKSVRADTVMTSSSAAGTTRRALVEEFPAATVYLTPAATERQIAPCSGSPVEQPDRLGLEPLLPRLMLATSILPALGVTQSTPQMTLDQEPAPEASSTRTAQSRAPGATPTTPHKSVNLAAPVPRWQRDLHNGRCIWRSAPLLSSTWWPERPVGRLPSAALSRFAPSVWDQPPLGYSSATRS